MSKKNKSGNQRNESLAKILLITAILELIKVIIEIIQILLG